MISETTASSAHGEPDLSDPRFFQDAVSFATRAHRHQIRKDGRTPYIAHPMRVALTIRVHFGCDDPLALLAALLHDTIEDTTTNYDDLADRFGTRVADCVAALTKNMALPEALRESSYDARLADAPWQARLVKLADQFDNVSDLPSMPEDKRREHIRKTLDRCARALAMVAHERATNADLDRAAMALEARIAAGVT
jgi:guanosine-3',5'-bis(diphosphate) 3'-pyrophosphohydrolase